MEHTKKINIPRVEIAIEALEGMFIWSDRIGSDEIAELKFVIKQLKKYLNEQCNNKKNSRVRLK